MKNSQSNLTILLENKEYKNNYKNFLKVLLEETFLLPFYNDNLIELETEENIRYIPLFTDTNQINDLEYTRLDEVKLEIVIRDIFKVGKFHAISINPYTHDYIINQKVVEIIELLKNRI